MSTKGLSSPRTTAAVCALLADLDWPRARVADVGAGRGHLCAVLGAELQALSVPSRGVHACHVMSCLSSRRFSLYLTHGLVATPATP